MTYAETSTHVHYVTARDGGRTALLLGPFTTHADAVARVDDARRHAVATFPDASFATFGTMRATLQDARHAPTGKLNHALGVAP